MSALPGPYVAVVLALGAFRVTRLIGWDDFPPLASRRDRLLRKTVDRNATVARERGTPAPVRYGRPVLAMFVQCPYCLGFWVGLTVWGLWLVAPTAAVVVMVPFALNAVVGIVARNLD